MLPLNVVKLWTSTVWEFLVVTKFSDESVVLRFQAPAATDELVLVVTDEEDREDETLLREDGVEELELETVTTLDDELAVPPHAVPVTTGISAEADPFDP